MKGILLAGGFGTRLHPTTRVVSKHLLPVYNKPMIYYPLSTLMLAGVRDVLLISTPSDLPAYERLLGSGAELGLRITYRPQAHPGGIAEAFLIGRDFVAGSDVALILGDNLFHGQGLSALLHEARSRNPGAVVFGCSVKDPERYGVVAFGPDGRVVDIREKPAKPPSPYAVTGLYFYASDVVDVAARMTPSARGELEITDVNRAYLAEGRLHLVNLPRGVAWMDAGTPDALLEAANLIALLENRHGLRIACLEEIAYRMGFIDRNTLQKLAANTTRETDRAYLEDLVASTAGSAA